MMTRRGIIAALLAGIARAQTLQIEPSKSIFIQVEVTNDPEYLLVIKAHGQEVKLTTAEVMTTLASPPAWESGQALNNQCPVCGAMAEPYVRATTTIADSYETTDDGRVLPINPREEPYGPMTNMTACLRCNAAFWQGAAA